MYNVYLAYSVDYSVGESLIFSFIYLILHVSML